MTKDQILKIFKDNLETVNFRSLLPLKTEDEDSTNIYYPRVVSKRRVGDEGSRYTLFGPDTERDTTYLLKILRDNGTYLYVDETTLWRDDVIVLSNSLIGN